MYEKWEAGAAVLKVRFEVISKLNSSTVQPTRLINALLVKEIHPFAHQYISRRRKTPFGLHLEVW